MTTLHIVICTHNRHTLLERAIRSLDEATRPDHMSVEILVVANACTDETVSFLEASTNKDTPASSLPLKWVKEPEPGKSHALNTAIATIDDGFIAFVDDDHRVDSQFLVAIEQAITSRPDENIFCGRILPDWDGSEPAWTHDSGPFMIFPLPIPKFDLGPAAHRLDSNSPLPGGGNLIIARSVFNQIGGFSTNLGPKGHDLGGSEDTDLLIRARKHGSTIEYDNRIIQYHYVDNDRLRLTYLLRKAFHRNRTITLARRSQGRVPRYLFRQLAGYFFNAVFSLHWDKRRFHMVRTAGTLGQIVANLSPPPEVVQISRRTTLSAVVAIAVIIALAGLPALILGFSVGIVLITKSLFNFTRSGPKVREEILAHYRLYAAWCVLRLGAVSMILASLLAAAGIITINTVAPAFGHPVSIVQSCVAGLFSLGLLTGIQFCRQLLYLPSSICASAQYRFSRMYPLWKLLSPGRIRKLQIMLIVAWATVIGVSIVMHLSAGNPGSAAISAAAIFAAAILYVLLREPALPESKTPAQPTMTSTPPNIVMIGADTLRVDRLSCQGYQHQLTPFIDSLVSRGILFTNCYVPLARTAPSLLSLFSGLWPHNHGVRDNFVSDAEANVKADFLPNALRRFGYRSHVISDWSGGDFRKFPFGFDEIDVPEDQWNIKYYIRQGPLDLRLFISLFTHNRLGKAFLPELFYLAGVPLTTHIGSQTRHALASLSQSNHPFLLNVFMGTTHAPYGSEYPYYQQYSDPDYSGPSKFVMAKFADPMEIIESQEAERSRFDVDQVLNLYDGCVNQFDDEVKRIVTCVDELGITDNTVIVIYSDHGTDFFENHTWGQGNTVVGSDPSAKIPLLIIDPRNSESRKVDDLVRTVDFAPTILEIVGCETDAEYDGVSLAKYCRGEAGSLSLPAYQETGIWLGRVPGMHNEHLHYPHLLELLTIEDKEVGTLSIAQQYQETILRAKDRMIRRGKWKLTYFPLSSGGYFQLFDMDNDPACKNDMKEQYPAEFEELKLELVHWMQQDPSLHHAETIV